MLMNNRKRLLAVLVLALLIGLAVWLLGCDSRRPAEPEEQVLKDYAVYAKFSYNVDSMLIYHPLTRQADTVLLPYYVSRGMRASADGSRLYLSTRGSESTHGRILVLDTDSFAVITELPFAAAINVAVSPDNQLLAIPGAGLHILRTSDFSAVYADSSELFWPSGFARFSADRRFLYVAGGYDNPSAEVTRIDLTDGNFPMFVRPFAEGVSEVVPTPDGGKWILALGGGGWGGSIRYL